MKEHEHLSGASRAACAASPRLEVVARPRFDVAAAEALLGDAGLTWRRTPSATDAENLIEMAGRLCYLSFGERQSPKSNREYIRHLIVHEHESVLEHASWSFALAGISRGFSHQLVRHRVGFSFSQLSQQYVDQGDASAVMPEEVRRSPRASALWERSIAEGRESYRELLAVLEEESSELSPRERLRSIRSAARSVLPEGGETKVLFSANARALRHFLAIRGSIEGDEEMRCVSATLLSALEAEAPSVFEDFFVEALSDGLPVVRLRSHGG